MRMSGMNMRCPPPCAARARAARLSLTRQQWQSRVINSHKQTPGRGAVHINNDFITHIDHTLQDARQLSGGSTLNIFWTFLEGPHFNARRSLDCSRERKKRQRCSSCVKELGHTDSQSCTHAHARWHARDIRGRFPRSHGCDEDEIQNCASPRVCAAPALASRALGSLIVCVCVRLHTPASAARYRCSP